MATGFPERNIRLDTRSSPPLGHVDWNRLTQADLVEIDRNIRASVTTASRVCGNPYGHEHSELTAAIAAHTLDGRAAQGLQLGLLCEGRLGEGKIRKKLVGGP